MITRRFVLTGFVTTAAVAAASHYIPTVETGREIYATVYGVGWDGEVIEHHIFEPMSVARFGGTPAIEQFREVTAFVHAFPVEPMPTTKYSRLQIDLLGIKLKQFEKPVEVKENGFTNIVGFGALNDWRAAQRPDLKFRGEEWNEIQAKATKENEVYWGEKDA